MITKRILMKEILYNSKTPSFWFTLKNGHAMVRVINNMSLEQ